MTLAASRDPTHEKYLSGDELEIWIAEHSIEPFGDDWLQAGTVAACILTPHRKPGTDPPKPQDFIPTVKKKSKQTPEEMAGVFASLKADHARR